VLLRCARDSWCDIMCRGRGAVAHLFNVPFPGSSPCLAGCDRQPSVLDRSYCCWQIPPGMTEPVLMVANRKAGCQHILRETAPVVHRMIRVRSWSGALQGRAARQAAAVGLQGWPWLQGGKGPAVTADPCCLRVCLLRGSSGRLPDGSAFRQAA
jgi:hypothetical protein